MDFIISLSKSYNKSVIMVVAYCISKYSHLLFSSTPIHRIHSGSYFYGQYIQNLWNASFYSD
jgi:hypothetical protein